MRHAVAGPSAAGMLLSSLQGRIYSVTGNSMSHNQRTYLVYSVFFFDIYQ